MKPVSLSSQIASGNARFSEQKSKAIVFDSGTLINFAMNGMFQEFRELKKIFNGKFLITKEVKSEIIDRPITIKRFELEALRLKE